MTDDDVERIIKRNLSLQMNLAGIRADFKEAQPKGAWVGLTDEDRQAAFESMPDMLEGFLKKWGWLHFSKAIEAKLKQKNGLTSKPQEELSKFTVADDINQLCMMGELPIQFEDLADWVADGKWPVNTDAPTKQLVETLLRALENEQDTNRLADVCVDATDAAVQLGRQYLGLVNKQNNSDLKKSECWCHSCNRDVLVNGFPFALTRMILCPDCGNKRCPKANNHTFACTNSNEPNQVGSAYNFCPK